MIIARKLVSLSACLAALVSCGVKSPPRPPLKEPAGSPASVQTPAPAAEQNKPRPTGGPTAPNPTQSAEPDCTQNGGPCGDP